MKNYGILLIAAAFGVIALATDAMVDEEHIDAITRNKQVVGNCLKDIYHVRYKPGHYYLGDTKEVWAFRTVFKNGQCHYGVCPESADFESHPSYSLTAEEFRQLEYLYRKRKEDTLKETLKAHL